MKISPSIINFTKRINLCPLCNKKKTNQYNKTYYNRYSEEFSELLNIPSKLLMQTTRHLKCNNCGLIYKKNWFKKNILSKMYLKKIPVHPSGWDMNSNKFSKNYLKIVILKFKSYLRNGNFKKIKEIKILLRKIKSIVDAIKIKKSNERKLKYKFLNALDNQNLDLINSYQKKIISMVNEPREFSRFKGFEDEKLFSFIEHKIGKIYNYAEIGCPLWGMLNIAKKRGCKTFFIKPEDSVFWGTNCKKNGIKCVNKISNFSKIIQFNNTKCKFDFLGVYALLDHYDNLIGILKKIFSVSKSVGIISENNNRGLPIQHSVGMNEKSAKYIAKRFCKKLNSSFKNIQITQDKFYLFY